MRRFVTSGAVLLLILAIAGVALAGDKSEKALRKQREREAKLRDPSVSINASPTTVRSALIDQMTMLGFQIDEESEHVVRFCRDTSGKEEFGSRLLVGSSRSETPRKCVRYTFIPQPQDAVRIMFTCDLSAKMPLGNTSRVDLTNNPRSKAQILDLLDGLKLEFDRTTP